MNSDQRKEALKEHKPTLASLNSLISGRLRATGLRMKAMWTFLWVPTGLQHRSDTSVFSSTLKTKWTDPWIW